MSLEGLVLDEEHPSKHLVNSIQMVDRCIRDVRTLSYLLYPPMLEETGLATAIRWHLEGFSKRSGIQTTYEIADDVSRLPRDAELALFRIVQESLTNIHRHSESKTAHIRFVVQHGEAIVEVKDQGKGMPTCSWESDADSIATLGVGIRGMRERVRQLNGQLEIFSSPEGTSVRASIPLESQ
jgi:signal transduction histidine kinase